MAANCGASSASNGLKMRLEFKKKIEILDFLASVLSQIQLTTSEALLRIRELQDYFTKVESTRDEFFHLLALENIL